MNIPFAAGQGATLGDVIATAIARYPDRIAFVNDEATVGYRELGAQISQVQQYFAELGLRPGDAVAQLGVNRYEVFVVIAAAYLSGLRSVTLHALGSRADHDFIIRDCDARVVIVDEYYRARGDQLRESCGDGRVWLSFGRLDGCLELAERAGRHAPKPLTVYGDAEHIIRVAYTGGTTGRSKGVMQSNRALLTNLLLDLAAKPWPADVRYLCAGPISHGAGSLVIPTLARGGRITLLRSFSADRLVDTIRQHACNVTWLVPTMLYALLDSPRVGDVDWSDFHSIVYSAAPAAPTRIREALNLLGPILVQSYGQTECPNDVLLLDQADHARLSDAQLAAAGRPYPTVRVALLDERGIEVPTGSPGELCVRGPLLMSGYLNNPEETARVFEGGWLHTGDIACRADDGLYYLVDRKKDMIVSGGFNVYPKEVEDIICAHPGVAAAAVVGVPDPKWGEMVMAYVQRREGPAVGEDELRAFVRERGSSIVAPKRVAFVDALPLTALGKVDKKALRAPHWSAGARAVN
ncbi:MAG: AMP-binding protein [Lautropia sp.]